MEYHNARTQTGVENTGNVLLEMKTKRNRLEKEAHRSSLLHGSGLGKGIHSQVAQVASESCGAPAKAVLDLGDRNIHSMENVACPDLERMGGPELQGLGISCVVGIKTIGFLSTLPHNRSNLIGSNIPRFFVVGMYEHSKWNLSHSVGKVHTRTGGNTGCCTWQ